MSFTAVLHGGPAAHEGIEITSDCNTLEVFAGGCVTPIDGQRHYVVAVYAMDEGGKFWGLSCVTGDSDRYTEVRCPHTEIDPDAFWEIEDRSSSGE